VSTDPVHGCFNNPEGLNNGHLPSGCGPQVHELANGLGESQRKPSAPPDGRLKGGRRGGHPLDLGLLARGKRNERQLSLSCPLCA
jgi:hypothetical protein